MAIRYVFLFFEEIRVLVMRLPKPGICSAILHRTLSTSTRHDLQPCELAILGWKAWLGHSRHLASRAGLMGLSRGIFGLDFTIGFIGGYRLFIDRDIFISIIVPTAPNLLIAFKISRFINFIGGYRQGSILRIRCWVRVTITAPVWGLRSGRDLRSLPSLAFGVRVGWTRTRWLSY